MLLGGGKGADSSSNGAAVDPVRQPSSTCNAHQESSSSSDVVGSDEGAEGPKGGKKCRSRALIVMLSLHNYFHCTWNIVPGRLHEQLAGMKIHMWRSKSL